MEERRVAVDGERGFKGTGNRRAYWTAYFEISVLFLMISDARIARTYVGTWVCPAGMKG